METDQQLELYMRRLAISERLASEQPLNASWQRDLMAACDDVGSTLEALGDIPGAAEMHRRSQAVSDRIPATGASLAG